MFKLQLHLLTPQRKSYRIHWCFGGNQWSCCFPFSATVVDSNCAALHFNPSSTAFWLYTQLPTVHRPKYSNICIYISKDRYSEKAHLPPPSFRTWSTKAGPFPTDYLERLKMSKIVGYAHESIILKQIRTFLNTHCIHRSTSLKITYSYNSVEQLPCRATYRLKQTFGIFNSKTSEQTIWIHNGMSSWGFTGT